jgi:hypothetical protein
MIMRISLIKDMEDAEEKLRRARTLLAEVEALRAVKGSSIGVVVPIAVGIFGKYFLVRLCRLSPRALL